MTPHPTTPRPPPAWLAHFGSLRTALAGMALLAVAVLVGRFRSEWLGVGLIGALLFLALNLLVALWAHPALRRQVPLLVFHLALLGLVVASGLGRMTALDGRFELTEGVPWDGTLMDGVAGRWHPDRLAQLSFMHSGFEIRYAPGLKRGPTRNRVHWTDADGRPQDEVIGDHHPLVLRGYRIYTSPNKGYAPLMRWTPTGGEAAVGALHLPSFPAQALRQSLDWQLPGGPKLWLQLPVDPALIDPDAAGRFRLPDDRTLVLRLGGREVEGEGEQRLTLAPGASVDLPGGRLDYLELRTWMGYRVSYDLSLGWLLGLALLATGSLGWHYARQFWAASPRPAGAPLASTPGSAAMEAR
ncbi:cytochrome c biogenesis protein ResB [Leptothrix discophora]|uniref:ResB-like domain-containing protein n=1 Tax=Leptothrix discophora TaxID=89 RepID=A0ABT9FXZ8_LEPDI|nr:hypothetical protein [Leptothrix discophora]MDP4299113.1 hypothetical protein [Leptothrix discophora]